MPCTGLQCPRRSVSDIINESTWTIMLWYDKLCCVMCLLYTWRHTTVKLFVGAGCKVEVSFNNLGTLQLYIATVRFVIKILLWSARSVIWPTRMTINSAFNAKTNCATPLLFSNIWISNLNLTSSDVDRDGKLIVLWISSLRVSPPGSPCSLLQEATVTVLHLSAHLSLHGLLFWYYWHCVTIPQAI